MNSNALFEGIGVALVTFFNADGLPNIRNTARHAEDLTARGCRAILLAGTTGEFWRLSGHDRIELAEAIRERVPNVPLLIGTGDLDTGRALALTAEVARAKVADALLVLSATDKPVREFYQRVSEAAEGTPVIAYHLPVLSPPGIDVEALDDLPVIGIKDSSGSADRLGEMLVRKVRSVYVGSANLLLLAGACGADGALLALANTQLDRCIQAWNGSKDAQRQLMIDHIESLIDFPSRLKPAILQGGRRMAI
jgi:4-hydroxy-tetrahydrodipicolinate synthase